MTKDRHLRQHNWENLRADIQRIIKDKRLSPAEFRPLDLHENWWEIEENIYQTFCKLEHPSERPIWLWEYFKLDTFSIAAEQPYRLLDKLIDEQETVWFFVNGDQDKLWFYEGKINGIVQVIEESRYIDELYLASKKYRWLICINHHDDLIVTGETLATKLRQLK